MKYKIIILLFLLKNIVVFSQPNMQYAKAKVTYEAKTFINKNILKHKVLLESFPEAAPKIETIASEFDFSLILNDNCSVFYLEKKLYSDNLAAKLAIIHLNFYGIIKQESENFITEELEEDFGRFLVSREYQKWELHDKSKVIGEYTCFKATTSYTTTNPKGKVFKHNFTAWYTPQLPYKYGPAGYGNLPGLIIELQGDNFTYGVKKIQFYDDDEKSKKNKMPSLKRLKLISEEEFEALAAMDEKRWQENHN